MIGSVAAIPEDGQQLLLHSKDGQILSLFQDRFLLGKLTAGFAFFFHVFSKLLLSPKETPEVLKLPLHTLCYAYSPHHQLSRINSK